MISDYPEKWTGPPIFFERGISMSTSTDDIRIIRLPPMRVACVNGFGPGPEQLAIQQMTAYVQATGLDCDGQAHRFFGFNDPDPSAGSPNYGYDLWITVGPEAPAHPGVSFHEFAGGLYAVKRIRPSSGEEIYPSWQALTAWRARSPYRPAQHQWLEEHIGDLSAGFPHLILDLYLPIAE
jgi:DNA gyrase inhibitor GyrI